MKSNILTLCALLSVSASSAVGVKMPQAAVIQQRLDGIGLTHFAEKTGIVKRLADKNLEALGVCIAVETSLYDYNENLAKGMPAPLARTMQIQMQMSKPMLIEALLQDSPEGLEEVRGLGLLGK